eukprot:IDg4019t1
MRYSAICEVFWEAIEKFHDEKSHLVSDFRIDLMKERASDYSKCIHENGAALDKLHWFHRRTKIKMSRPGEGRRPDAYIYQKSGLGPILEEHLFIDGKQYCIFGDAAYILRAWMQIAFPREGATVEERAYNKSMCGARIAVEWSYGEVKQHFTSQDFSRKLHVRRAPIATLYICSVLYGTLRYALATEF